MLFLNGPDSDDSAIRNLPTSHNQEAGMSRAKQVHIALPKPGEILSHRGRYK